MPPMLSPRTTRIMHIASGDLWAGAEAQVCTLLKALNARSDVRVAAAVMNPGELADRLRQAQVECRTFDERTLSPWKIAQGLRAFMRAFEPHVVHTHRQKENVIGACVAATLGVPSIRTVHGADEHPPSFAQLGKWLARRIDAQIAIHLQQRVVAVSEELAGKLARLMPGARIEVIDNMVDLASIASRAQNHQPKPPLAPWRIGLVGRLVPVKRVDLFLAAARLLDERTPGKFHFDIIGDGPLRECMTALAARNGVRACFHGFQADPLPLMSSLDALAITSDHEGLPTVALEALALGVPVVSRDIGGLRALAAAGGNCTIVPEPNELETGLADAARAEALASAIHRAVTLGNRQPSLPRQFTSESVSARYEQLYRNVSSPQ